jgi:hypothetical protein
MWSLTQRVRLSLIVLSVAGAGVSANAAHPPEALDAYVKAYTEMGKNAAVLFNNQNTQATAQTSMFTARADAQAKMLAAQAGWITAVANANATNAKTLETLQQVRGLALDNNLKVAKVFYDKRKLCEDYQKLNPRQRPTQESMSRYSQASVPKRPAQFELASTPGRIYWPDMLLDEEFSDGRIQLESLFAQRKAGASAPGSSISGEVQTVAAQMREQLQAKIRQMSPEQYLAARRFLESLAYEARFPARGERVASN